MTDRLKASITVHYTSNLGNYQSARVEAMKEFWVDENSVSNELKRLDDEVWVWMKDRGIAPTIIRAVPKDEAKK